MIDSHYHYDHAHGNQIFGPEVQVIGHENARKRMLGNVLEQYTDLTDIEPVPARVAALRERIGKEPDPQQKATLERQVRDSAVVFRPWPHRHRHRRLPAEYIQAFQRYLRDLLTRLPTLTNWQIKDVTPQAWAKSQNGPPPQSRVVIVNVVAVGLRHLQLDQAKPKTHGALHHAHELHVQIDCGPAKAVSISLSREEWYSLFAAARGAPMP